MKNIIFICILLLTNISYASNLILTDYHINKISIKFNGKKMNVYAGELNVIYDDYYSPAYCIELDENIYKNYEYDMTLKNLNNLEIAWLMNSYDNSLYNKDYLNISDTALQVSIWKTIYKDDFELLTKGKINNLSEYYLEELKNVTDFSDDLSNKYKMAYISGYQDLIVKNNFVPEPMTFILLLTGLGFYIKKRKL